MLIKESVIEKVLNNSELFGDLIKTLKIDKPTTLVRALERKSKYTRQNVSIVDFLRDKGFRDEEIFDKEDIQNVFDNIR